ncbi:AraC family transcriptional regulator [Bifidobacterium sp.]|uniref:helix-turn-helix transcriptional regulator n=1 Tax=Bifidobacterium sp. TaxID=41200 RepID=UPI0039E9F9ED
MTRADMQNSTADERDGDGRLSATRSRRPVRQTAVSSNAATVTVPKVPAVIDSGSHGYFYDVDKVQHERIQYPLQYPAAVHLHEERPAQFIPLHWHRGMEIIHSFAGSLRVRIDGIDHQVNDGDTLIISPAALHSIHPNDASTPQKVLSVTFDGSHLARICPGLQTGQYGIAASDEHSKEVEELSQICADVAETLVHLDDEANYLAMNHLLYLMLYLVYPRFIVSNEDDADNASINADSKIIKDILAYMDVHCSEDIKAETVARFFGYSRGHLCRLLKRYAGITFKPFLTELRLQGAIADLLETTHSCEQVAFDNGFPSIGALGSAMKKKYGMGPRQFRRSHGSGVFRSSHAAGSLGQ